MRRETIHTLPVRFNEAAAAAAENGDGESVPAPGFMCFNEAAAAAAENVGPPARPLMMSLTLQ